MIPRYALRSAASARTRLGVCRYLSSSSTTLIPQRGLWDTIYSGTKGIISLISSEKSRRSFMASIESANINAEVLKQARFGNMLTIALFHDLQDPVWEKYNFDVSDFLMGVKPALRNFHETMGQLQNEFPSVTSQEERTEKLLQRMHQIVTSSMHRKGSDGNTDFSLPDNLWKEQAEKDPESHAGQLGLMVSPKLFDSLFLTTETAAMLASYKEGTTNVSYVAVLSARAMIMDNEEVANDNSESVTNDGEEGKQSSKDDKLKSDTDTIEAKEEGEEDAASGEPEEVDTTPVAAQIEVLYEMEQKIEVKPEIFNDPVNPATDALKSLKEEVQRSDSISGDNANKSSSSATPPIIKDERQIWVGTFEAWLNGGNDGGLRWRITNMRPPNAEFPGLYGGY
ncbi:expressed unknown protein [Seminavis robusta]|uniref:Uncharacterized protein n=1 Tax=Seminavis robusta TaxID=568900 RepID=A0A9N8DPG4_9STRA|nr:expressed unknown protein [Seminavis robusta]|eukprot:Sro168_g074700.1 n/a (397) ;mRNA; r:14351-15541